MNKIKKKKNTNGFSRSFQSLSLGRKGLLFFFLCILSLSVLPAVIVLLIGLLPTLTILVTDSKNYNKLIIVGGFNLAGIFIYFFNIINQFSIDGALNILSNVFNLIIMLGSAGIGLIIYYEVPNLFVFLSKISANKRIAAIDKRLQKLSEEWGTEIIEDQISKLSK